MSSQYGEDRIVAELFTRGSYLAPGTLLEIGAYEPEALSNSRYFIDNYWSAVLVEFSPAAVKDLVRAYAGNDKVTVVQAAVTPEPNHVVRFEITDDALSTNDPRVLETWREKGGYYGSLWVQTIPLRALVEQFFGDRAIDYCSIDTEGTSVDLAIALLRMDHRPLVLCVEHDQRFVELASVYQPLAYTAVHTNETNIIISRI